MPKRSTLPAAERRMGAASVVRRLRGRGDVPLTSDQTSEPTRGRPLPASTQHRTGRGQHKRRAGPMLRFSSPSNLPPPMGYSHVAEVTRGRLVYISGQVPMDAAGQLVGGDDFMAQVEQVFANLGRALESAGASFRDVVKLTYFCVERVPADAIAAVRQVRDRYVNLDAPPASSFVVVSRLVRPEWLIEIEALAAVGA